MLRTDKLKASKQQEDLLFSGVLMETIPDLPYCLPFVTNVKLSLASDHCCAPVNRGSMFPELR